MPQIDINQFSKKEVYIIGHKHPDADSLFSACLLTRILKSKGIKAIFSVMEGPYNQDDIDMIQDYLLDTPTIIKNFDQKEFILVDHNDYTQSVGKQKILLAIDHHIHTHMIQNTIESEYASTALFIYDLFKKEYSFSPEEKMMIALSVMADTNFLVSSRYRQQDKNLFNELNLQLNVSELQKKYFKTTDFSKGIETNFLSDYKRYNRNSLSIHKVAFKTYQKDRPHLPEYIKHLEKQEGIWLLIWSEYDGNHTDVYLKKDTFYHIEYPYTVTSAVLTIQDLEEKGYFKQKELIKN